MAFVQSAQINTTGTSAALAYASNNTGNNLLLCTFRRGGTENPTSVTDTRGNTWTLAKQQVIETSGSQLFVYYVPSCIAGANTVTAAFPGSGTVRMAILEYNDFGATGAVLDQVAGANNLSGSNAAPDSGPVTTTSATELLFSAAALAGTQSFTAGTNYTEREEVVQKLSTEERAVTTTGTYNGTWTIPAGDEWGCILATFMAIPGGGSLIWPVRMPAALLVR